MKERCLMISPEAAGTPNYIGTKESKTEDYFLKYKEYLMTSAEDKDMPPEYKYGSIEQRLQLIQGLMDIAGSICNTDEHKYNMQFTSTSIKLIKSFQEILWSLGYASTICYDNRMEKGICYSLNIDIPNEEKYKFFKLKRKKEIAEQARDYHKRKDYSKTSIISIQKLEEQKEMICIYVDNPEHLYLTNDYVVTHNTTLAKFIIASLPGVNPETDVCYCSLTGKATQVLLQKGNKNVLTLHRLMYESYLDEDGTWIRTPVKSISYKVLVIDEISMVPKHMLQKLITYDTYILGLGDPAQLPPRSAEDENYVLNSPHVFLDEVHRQAQESEIIRLSMEVREGKPLKSFKGKEVMVLPYKEYVDGMLTWADQTIVATNAMRAALNHKTRTLLGYEGPPQDGEKLICLKNEWQILSTQDFPLVNGTVGFLQNSYQSFIQFKKTLYPKPVKTIVGNLSLECGGVFTDLSMDKHMLETGEKFCDGLTAYKISKDKKQGYLMPLEFAYGYAVTCHKFQGSSAKKVLGFEENFPTDAVEHQKYLYTLITRAEEKLVLIKRN